MPVSARPITVSGPSGSVLVDGSPCVPATAAGVAVGTVAIGAAVGAVVAAPATGVVVGATTGAGVKVVIGAGTGVAVAPGATVNGGRVGGIGAVWHDVDTNVSVSNVTAPFRASVLPSTVTPVVTVMEVRARIVPTKEEPVPRVAELLTCQKTLHALAPLISWTELVEDVMRVDGDLKIQTELGSF
jgi:hypothetical protein